MRATLADFKCFGVVHKFAKLIVESQKENPVNIY